MTYFFEKYMALFTMNSPNREPVKRNNFFPIEFTLKIERAGNCKNDGVSKVFKTDWCWRSQAAFFWAILILVVVDGSCV